MDVAFDKRCLTTAESEAVIRLLVQHNHSIVHVAQSWLYLDIGVLVLDGPDGSLCAS